MERAKFCVDCKRRITKGRLAVLPGTEKCIRCSDVRALTEDDLEMVLDRASGDELVKQNDGDGGPR